MQESERIFIAENATLLRGSERELNRQLFTILNSIYDGLYITDGQANTILINRAYEEVSGLRREDVLGKSMQEIVATGMIDRSGSLGVLKTRKPVTLEQTFRTGKQALITSTPHFDSSGEITMIITVVRDMTEIYGLQRKYQESEERRRSEMEFLQRNQRFVSRMVAADPRTLEVLARAQKVAALDTTILLLGETGVGKEQFARYIYENSARARQSFIGINCGAIPASLIESELFGYEKGAFTGASKEGKMGVFESADKGTVFLDEVGDLPLEMQVHLLRVLQEMQVRRVGGVRSISVDVRIIAATNRNLLDMVHEKTFREDQCGAHRDPAPAGAQAGHSPAGGELSQGHEQEVPLSEAVCRRSHGDSIQLRLARQRAGAEKRSGAGGDPQRRGRDPALRAAHCLPV